jgi:hypothetical protein
MVTLGYGAQVERSRRNIENRKESRLMDHGVPVGHFDWIFISAPHSNLNSDIESASSR